MGRSGLKLLFDTYAFVELFRGSKEGEWVRLEMEKGEEILTVDFVLTEIARKYVREGVGEERIRERLQFIVEHATVLAVDTETALLAARTWVELNNRSKKQKLNRSPALANAVMLAAARKVGARLVSGDPHVLGLPETMWMERD